MSRRGTLAEEGKSRIAIAVSDAMTTNAVPLNALQADDLLGLVPRQLAAAGDDGAPFLPIFLADSRYVL